MLGGVVRSRACLRRVELDGRRQSVALVRWRGWWLRNGCWAVVRNTRVQSRLREADELTLSRVQFSDALQVELPESDRGRPVESGYGTGTGVDYDYVMALTSTRSNRRHQPRLHVFLCLSR